MSIKNNWSFTFFNQPDYLSLYKDMTGPRRTKREINFIQKAMQPQSHHLLLDAPCGAGRHTHALTKLGYQVIGLDFSPYLLSQFPTTLLGKRLSPDRVQGVLQHLPFQKNTFDHVVNLFSSFGYEDTEDENVSILEEYARILKPGGKLLIDVMNRHFIIPRLNPVYHSIQSGLKVKEERTITDNNHRLYNIITVTDKQGNTRKYVYNPWLYNGWELSLLANKAGLSVDTLYGNFTGEPYQTDSERAMLIALKP